MAWLGVAWLGLAWLGLAWLGLQANWLGLARHNYRLSHNYRSCLPRSVK